MTDEIHEVTFLDTPKEGEMCRVIENGREYITDHLVSIELNPVRLGVFYAKTQAGAIYAGELVDGLPGLRNGQWAGMHPVASAPGSPTGGLIAFYGLEDWWLSSFSAEERAYMTQRYRPMGGYDCSLTEGRITDSSQRVDVFLSTLTSWFMGESGKSIRKRIFVKLAELTISGNSDKPGDYQGRHYTTYVGEIEDKKRDGDLKAAEKDLLGIIRTMERKARKPIKITHINGETEEYIESVAPWYYWQLAVIYRKQKEYAKEIAIIERHFSVPYTDGCTAQKLRERLVKARALLEKRELKQLLPLPRTKTRV